MKLCVQALTSLICEDKLRLDGKEVKYLARSLGESVAVVCLVRTVIFYDRNIVEERARINNH